MLAVTLIITTLHSFIFFFFNDTATTEIYTLPLHDALPIFLSPDLKANSTCFWRCRTLLGSSRKISSTRSCACGSLPRDRKSTRLNSSHDQISYAVFCLKKKK